MKRSEILDLIERSGYLASKLDADAFLNLIEQAGMQPPDTGKGIWINTVTPTNHIDVSKEKDYRWEKE